MRMNKKLVKSYKYKEKQGRKLGGVCGRMWTLGVLGRLASHIVKVTHKNQVNLRRDEELTGKRTNERNGCMKGGADGLDADGLEIEGEAAGVYAPCKEA
jgi:single-stranded DNA-specific DHH superfamily exonuclease